MATPALSASQLRRREKLRLIQARDLQVCYKETNELHSLLGRLEKMMAHFLTDQLPPEGTSYAGIMATCIRRSEAHHDRLPYWLYLRSNRFGKCRYCDNDLPLSTLNPKRARIVCQQCQPNAKPR